MKPSPYSLGHKSLLLIVPFLLIFSVGLNNPPTQNPANHPGNERVTHWAGGMPVNPNRHYPTQPAQTAAQPSLPSLDMLPWIGYVEQVYQETSGGWDIRYSWQMNSTTPAFQINLTPDSADDTFPRLNHDAHRVVFASDRSGNFDIYTIGIDGAGRSQLTTQAANDSEPAWAPDDSAIVFVSDRDGNPEIYQMKADGSNPIRMTFSADFDLFPNWSPDGKHIAWIRTDGNKGAIWVMDANGQNGHPITSPIWYPQHPVWSPDNTRIAFDFDSNADGWTDLAIINADGSNPKILKFGNSQYSYNTDFWMGAWTPGHNSLIITGIAYFNYNSTWYIDSAVSITLDLTGLAAAPDAALNLPATYTVNLHPDARPRDLTGPVTTLDSLPAYTPLDSALLHWSTYDSGPAFLDHADVEYQSPGTGSWSNLMTLLNRDYRYQFMNPGHTGFAAGQKLHIRVRATDQAGNAGDWKETSTTLYASKISGNLVDNRGLPIINTLLSILPAPILPTLTDLAGRFTAYLSTIGSYSVSAPDPAYTTPPAAAFDTQNTSEFDTILAPKDNVLAGGGFEDANPLQAWSVSGSLPVTAIAGHTGTAAAQLGASCTDFCLGMVETPVTDWTFNYPLLAVDSFGNVNILYTSMQHGLSYITRDPKGNWSERFVFQNVGSSNSDIYNAIAIDKNNTVHVLLNSEFYAEKPSGGTWSIASPVPNYGYVEDMVVSPDGVTHLLFSNGKYTKRIPAEGWTDPVVIFDGEGGWSSVAMALVGDGSIDFLFHYMGFDIINRTEFRTLKPDGSLTPMETFEETAGGQISNDAPARGLAIQKDGTVSVLTDRYFERSSTGAWSYPSAQIDGSDFTMAAAPDGSLILFRYNSTTNHNEYYVKPQDATTFKLTVLPDVPFLTYGSIHPIFDSAGRMYLTWEDNTGVHFQSTLPPGGSGQAQIVQTLTIPASLHAPTLAYMVNFVTGLPFSKSYLEISAVSAYHSVKKTITKPTSGWTPGWIDLTAFARENTTITFTLYQKDTDAPVRVQLDDISVGSWLTPVITALSPAQVIKVDVKHSTVTLYGSNFIQTPQVLFGKTASPTVQWIDGNTLVATIPPGLGKGRYDVTVVNPGGAQSVLLRGFELGAWLYLPSLVIP